MEDQPELSAVLNKIEMLVERSRYKEARKEIATWLSTEPSNVELLFNLAHIEYLTDNHGKAETVARNLLSIEPDHYRGRVILFHILEATKKLPQAEQIVIELIRDYPEESENYVRYSRLMLQTHNFSKAKALAEESLRLAPDSSSALLAVLLCKHTQDPIAPETDMAELIRMSPESASTMLMLIASLSEAGKYERALSLAQQLVRAYPHDAGYREIVINLRAETHWLMAPLRPLRKFGWKGSAAFWVVCVFLFRYLDDPAYQSFSGYVYGAVLAYVVYSWVAPPLLTKWLTR